MRIDKREIASDFSTERSQVLLYRCKYGVNSEASLINKLYFIGKFFTTILRFFTAEILLTLPTRK